MLVTRYIGGGLHSSDRSVRLWHGGGQRCGQCGFFSGSRQGREDSDGLATIDIRSWLRVDVRAIEVAKDDSSRAISGSVW